jgi:cobalt/nickel transport system ATP-binding protein
MEPRILVADEPTGDLDPTNSRRVEELLRSLRDKHGISVVVALHDMDMAARLADRICIVKEGSIVAEGRPEDVLYNETLLKSAGLELPTVARMFVDLGLDDGKTKRPLKTEDLMPLIRPSAKKREHR